ncbi:MAG: YitT family protein, partial [Kineothrix sp.]|nr:YitT family protein [Kineothrix sp.]
MKQKSIHITILLNIFGTFLYMVGIKVFAAPARIAPGGASGIAVLINYLTGFPIGLFCSLFSIPLLI